MLSQLITERVKLFKINVSFTLVFCLNFSLEKGELSIHSSGINGACLFAQLLDYFPINLMLLCTSCVCCLGGDLADVYCHCYWPLRWRSTHQHQKGYPSILWGYLSIFLSVVVVVMTAYLSTLCDFRGTGDVSLATRLSMGAAYS